MASGTMYSDLIGVPFLDRGRDPQKGLDCYGLAIELFRRHGIDLPPYWVSCVDASLINKTIAEEKENWQLVGIEVVPSLAVVRFNSGYLNHVLVNIGNGKFIHTGRKIGVRIERFDDSYWRRRYEGFYVPKEVKF